MNDIANLPVCTACGTPLPELATKQERLEKENTRLFRECSHLKGELTKIQGSGSETKDIEALHDLWLALRGPKRGVRPALTDDRVRAYRRLLKNYGEDATNAIKQHRKTPYLVFGKWEPTGTDKDYRDDVTDIVLKGKYVEALINAFDGNDVVPQAPQGTPTATTPEAHKLHHWDHWNPLNRAVAALRREGGFDTANPEWDERTLLNDHPSILRWHTWCPRHDHAFVGLRLWAEDSSGRVQAECDGACQPIEIVRAVFALEERQVERAKALVAFERTATPETLDKVVKALSIHKDDSQYRIGRRMGIHDDETLGLHVDPREVKWAA